MFINKITSAIKPTFKGYQHVVNDMGEAIYRFNVPFDYETENCKLQIFKIVPTENYNYKFIHNPVLEADIQAGGVEIDINSIPELEKDAPFAYRYVRTNKYTGQEISRSADTGCTISVGDDGRVYFWEEGGDKNSDSYTFVNRNTTTPRVQGAGYLVYPDSQRVGVKYRDFDHEKTGTIYTDKVEQAEMEKVIRTFSNKTGGNLAGLELNIDYLSQNKYKIQPANPIAGGDDKFSHRYANKNNFQIAEDMGNFENFKSYTRKLFQNGISYVHDSTFTSEGLEGIHFQYALRWADKNPQTYYWFKMQGLKDRPLGFGVIPKNHENLRHRAVNPPVIYDEKTKSIIENKDYNPNKETFFQIYDGSQVTDEQISKLDKPIDTYKKLKSGNPLSITNHDDTIANYLFEVNPKEYAERLEAFVDFNKGNDKPISYNSPESTALIAQFSNFKLIRKTVGGFVAWDANTDLVKLSYLISGYDEKINQAITDSSEKNLEKLLQIRGAYETQDMVLQNAKYWVNVVKNTQTLYTAQVLKGANSQKKIEELIANKLLPQEVLLSENAVSNILKGYYDLKPKGIMSTDDITLKAIMSLPLEALELGENTVGVLATSYFTNRAINKETLGLSRFELLKQNNPHLVKTYANIYNDVNIIFTDNIKSFATDIIKKVNETATEKLLDENNDYTEYGEYVIEQMGASITKYAFLKALMGKNLKTKILPNGEITYDYKDIKSKTTLDALGINPYDPQDEARQLQELIKKGMKNLDQTDVNYLAQSVSKLIEGTNVNSFRLAEAMIDKASLGMGIRIDALKDVVDQDAGRNRDVEFEENWDALINFWKRVVQTVKKESPTAYIQAELTDVATTMRRTIGEFAGCYDKMPDIGSKFRNTPEALTKFFNETGITSEAGYDYFFSTLMEMFGANFENGSSVKDVKDRCYAVINNLKKLVNTRNIDYIRNLLTFVDNHDKPRMVHGFALDMKLFHGSLDIHDEQGNINYERNRDTRINSMIQLANADDFDSLPLEAKLNYDNPEYFKTVSTYAVAMGQLIRISMNEVLKDTVSPEQMNYLKLALVDLVNGNFKDSGKTTKIPSINIKELSTPQSVLTEILKRANLDIPQHEFNAIIERTKDFDLINQFAVRGDYDTKDAMAKTCQNIAKTVLKGGHEGTETDEWDFMKYSPYIMNLAGLFRQAFIDVMGHNSGARFAFLNATKDFVKSYTREVVEANQTKLPYYESQKAAMEKNKFGALDIRTAIEMVVEQAEFIASKENPNNTQKLFDNTNEIVLKVWQQATEPAAQKMIMAMTLLSSLAGIPVLFAGDELVLSGYDEKTKNIYLPRNPLNWTETESGIFKDYITNVQKRVNEAMQIRSRDNTVAFNNGTPYIMRTSDEKVPAFLMQDANGNMTVSVFNYEGIKTEAIFDYFKDHAINNDNKEHIFAEHNIDSINPNNKYVPIQKRKEIDYIELGAGLALPIGLTFINSDTRDKAIYKVKKILNKEGHDTGRAGIFREGGRIILDGITAKNGTMVLSHLRKQVQNINFRGNNRKYNIVSNPYKKADTPIEGTKLSLLAK